MARSPREDELDRVRVLVIAVSRAGDRKSSAPVELLLSATTTGAPQNRSRRAVACSCWSLVGSVQSAGNEGLTEPACVRERAADRRGFEKQKSVMLTTASGVDCPR